MFRKGEHWESGVSIKNDRRPNSPSDAGHKLCPPSPPASMLDLKGASVPGSTKNDRFCQRGCQMLSNIEAGGGRGELNQGN